MIFVMSRQEHFKWSDDSSNFLIQYVSVFHFERIARMHLKSNETFRSKILGVFINGNAHQLTIYDVNHYCTSRNDMICIPSVNVYNSAQRNRISNLRYRLENRTICDTNYISTG